MKIITRSGLLLSILILAISCKTQPLKQDDFVGYLFAYFEGTGPGDQQEQLRFAVSPDAVNWSALNNNDPIIPSFKISNTGGIRDPYICRVEEGKNYYIVATDMYTKKGWLGQ